MVEGTPQATAWQQHAEQRNSQPGREPGRKPGVRRFLAAAQVRVALLFPAAPASPAPVETGSLVKTTLAQTAFVCVGAILLLLRVAHIPAWDSIYAEDNGVFLVGALAHPWHLLESYGGYEQLGPRLIGQLIASFVPLVYASDAYAAAGALITSACGLLLYHASEGYIRSRWLRAMLGAALVLLPLAPLEIIDSGVNSPWYTLTALFFAILWRPKSWPGQLAAALIAFSAASSEVTAFFYAPLLIMRLVALPRWREQAVTAGWVAGLLMQVLVVLASYTSGAPRLRMSNLSTAGQVIAFYFHNVVLRALGWKLSLHLIQIAGYNGATVIVGAVLAAGITWAMVVGGPPVRFFAVVALLTGFVETALSATITAYVNGQVPTWSFLPAARYSTVPVVLIDAILIVGVDAYLRRHGPVRLPRARAPRARFWSRSLVALTVLACLLGFGWLTDFRYASQRTYEGYWRVEAQQWLHECGRSQTGEISVQAWYSKATIECSRLRR